MQTITMQTSFSYKITLWALKFMGIKKQFSKKPIDYLAIRKSDIHQPKGSFFRGSSIKRWDILQTKMTSVESTIRSSKLVIFVHGGAFVSGPAKHHWDSIKTIYKATNATIWMCDYPKAPEASIDEMHKNINAIYSAALAKFKPQDIILLGDSAGGALVLSLIQRLPELNIPLPEKVIAISPVVDASFDNPAIDAIDRIDPMLGKEGVLSAKRLCANGEDLKNPKFSVLFGEVSHFPQTILFLSERDICYPDGVLFAEKLKQAGVQHEVITGRHMPHIWPLLPIMKEARVALKQMIERIG